MFLNSRARQGSKAGGKNVWGGLTTSRSCSPCPLNTEKNKGTALLGGFKLEVRQAQSMKSPKYWDWGLTDSSALKVWGGQRMLRARCMDRVTGGSLALAYRLEVHGSTPEESASKMRWLGRVTESLQVPATGLEGSSTHYLR